MNNRTIEYYCKLLVFYSISIFIDCHEKNGMITSSLIHFFQHTQIARASVHETVNEVAIL